MLTAKPLLSLAAGDLMSRDVLMVPQEMSLQGAARMLWRASVSGAPVVDAAGRCIGVLSSSDFVHFMEGSQRPQHRPEAQCLCSAWQIPDEDGEPAGSTVRDVMTGDPVLVAPGTPIGEVARSMLDAHIHRVVVAGPDGRPLGIVSATDNLAGVSQAALHARVPVLAGAAP